MAPQYRKEGSKLFKLNEEGTAYLFVYRNDRLKTLTALIREYLDELDWYY